MKRETMKLFGIVCVVLLVGTIGATTVSAMGVFDAKDRPSLTELKEKWYEVANEKLVLRAMLTEYGVEVPDLSWEQKKQIVRNVIKMWRDGAERSEIWDAVVDLLIGFGVDLPDLSAEQRAEIRLKVKTLLETEYGFVFIELTPEQKAYMKQTVFQLKRQGASREEIKIAVLELYTGYGGVIPELSDTQKEEIHDWFVGMMLADYGVALPDLSVEQRTAVKEQRERIRDLQDELRSLVKHAGFFTKIRFFRFVKQQIT